MSVNGIRFGKTGGTIQVGGLNTANAQTVAGSTATNAYVADTVVEVQDVSGSANWIDIGTAPSASADNGALIPANGITRPFILKAGNKVVGTGKINVRPLDTDNSNTHS